MALKSNLFLVVWFFLTLDCKLLCSSDEVCHQYYVSVFQSLFFNFSYFFNSFTEIFFWWNPFLFKSLLILILQPLMQTLPHVYVHRHPPVSVQCILVIYFCFFQSHLFSPIHFSHWPWHHLPEISICCFPQIFNQNFQWITGSISCYIHFIKHFSGAVYITLAIFQI